MELIWAFWCILGLIVGVMISGMVKREHDNDTDTRVYIPSRDRDRSGNNGRDEQMEHKDAEEVINGLQTLRMALSQKEKEYLDYALKCVQTIQRLQRMVDEGRLGDGD